MKNAEQLRKEADILQAKIKASINNFWDKVGQCDIQIDAYCNFSESQTGKKMITGIDVNVSVSV